MKNRTNLKKIILTMKLFLILFLAVSCDDYGKKKSPSPTQGNVAKFDYTIICRLQTFTDSIASLRKEAENYILDENKTEANENYKLIDELKVKQIQAIGDLKTKYLNQ